MGEWRRREKFLQRCEQNLKKDNEWVSLFIRETRVVWIPNLKSKSYMDSNGGSQYQKSAYQLASLVLLICIREWVRESEIRQSTIYYAGLLGRWDKLIIDQESDVLSIILFILFINLGHSKLFIFIFVIFLKNKKINWKDFCKEFWKKSWKK